MPKINPFMTFALEFKRKNGPNMSTKEAVKQAGSLWKEMSTEDRKIYNIKTNYKTNKVKEKLTCEGIPITTVKRELEEKLKNEDIMIKAIKNTINTSKNLEKEPFFFIYINFFDPEESVPAEVGLIKFSLKNGIEAKFHNYINPEVGPYMTYTIKKFTDDTHRLPLPPNAFGKESEKVFNEILYFLNNGDEDYLPTIYTLEEFMNSVTCFTKILKEKCPTVKENIKIFSIQELFYLLKKETSKKPISKEVAKIVLEKDTFQYTSNIACNYHENIDCSHYCALSQVIRWAYTFVDFICEDLDILLIPGNHIPDTFMVNSNFKTIGGKNIADAFNTLSLEPTFKDNSSKSSVSMSDQAAQLFDAISLKKRRSSCGRGIAIVDENELPINIRHNKI